MRVVSLAVHGFEAPRSRRRSRAAHDGNVEQLSIWFPWTGAASVYRRFLARLVRRGRRAPRVAAYVVAATYGGIVIGLYAGAAAMLFYWITTGSPLGDR